MSEEDVVQPEEGQGGESPYADYLNRIPEELRGDVEPVFKEWDANVTKKFQEAAEYRNQWEPYKETGVHHHDPQAVDWALKFYNALENPAAIKEWYEQYAQQNGLTVAEAKQVVEDSQGVPDEYGTFDSFGQPDTAQLEQLLAKQLGPLAEQVQALAQHREQQEFEQRRQTAEQEINAQLADLKEKNPEIYNQNAVEGFVYKYIESDPQHAVARAWEDYKAVHAQITTASLQEKVNNGRPAETGGSPDGAPEQIKTLADANRIALERIRASRG